MSAPPAASRSQQGTQASAGWIGPNREQDFQSGYLPRTRKRELEKILRGQGWMRSHGPAGSWLNPKRSAGAS